MRCLILALMVFLLPLRGWAGEMMATSMATDAGVLTSHQQKTTKTVAHSAHSAGVKGLFDHSESAPATSHDSAAHDRHHAAQGVQTHAEQDSHDAKDTDCGTGPSCQACVACHAVGLPSSMNAVVAVFTAAAPPLAAAAQFTSAQAVLGQKPPIS
jgi:hypothetical protein